MPTGEVELEHTHGEVRIEVRTFKRTLPICLSFERTDYSWTARVEMTVPQARECAADLIAAANELASQAAPKGD